MHPLTCAQLPQFPPDGAEPAIGVDPVRRPRVVAGERRQGQHSGDALFRQPTARGTHAAAPGVWTQGHVPSPCYGFALPREGDWRGNPAKQGAASRSQPVSGHGLPGAASPNPSKSQSGNPRARLESSQTVTTRPPPPPTLHVKPWR